jgi:hypothetical protein
MHINGQTEIPLPYGVDPHFLALWRSSAHARGARYPRHLPLIRFFAAIRDVG